MNTSTTPAQQTDKAALPIPENENELIALATPLGESILLVNMGGFPCYGIFQRSRAQTEQSDFFRIQFRGYSRQEGEKWRLFEGDDGHYHNVYNCAWVRVDKPSRTVTFGPKAGINLSLGFLGSDLETFLLANMIAWVKGSYADYAVSPGMVTMSQTLTEEERLQRQTLFTSQGFEFSWQGEDRRSALYFKDRVNKLLGTWNPELIVELKHEAILETFAKQEEARIELESKLNTEEATKVHLKQALQKERTVSQILTGVIILFAMFGFWLLL
ncbi:hypothetical protein HZU77_003615 [Neisseriaceae bacterium TC5R-5]|nr:hypothetical protein [Neisseriaceae bacterium TC5R-5]